MTIGQPGGPARASKIAQILGEVIIHHAPWTAEVTEAAKKATTTEWLDRFEAHTAGFVRPILEMVMANTDPPAPIKALIDEAMNPSAALSSIIEQIFGYNIAGSIVTSSLTPFLYGLLKDSNAGAVAIGQSLPISPADLAVGAVRGLAPGGQAIVDVPALIFELAAQSGVAEDDMQFLADIGGVPPSPEQLFEMVRRGLITADQVALGLKEGDTRDEWIETFQKLAYSWLTPLDFVRAAVQAQMSYADAEAWAAKTGLDTTTAIPLVEGDSAATPDMFGLAYAIAGRPPGPEELARMANRGLIPWTGTGAGALTFQQGIAESDVKTKWTPSLQALASYVPPPRSVGTLLERGVITEVQAVQFWEDGGVPADLAKAYATESTQQSTIQDKNLAKGEILSAYYDGIIDKADALEFLTLLGYTGQVATDIIAITDFRREIRALDAEVTRIGRFYTSDKITATEARDRLGADGLGLPASQIAGLMQIWGVDRITTYRLPSESQIGRAVKYLTLTPDQGIAALETLGFTAYDAAIVLSAEAEQAVTLPGAQAPGFEQV